MKRECDIYYFSDMQKCMKCGSSWDANDPYPPPCLLDEPVKVSFIDLVIARFFGDKKKR